MKCYLCGFEATHARGCPNLTRVQAALAVVAEASDLRLRGGSPTGEIPLETRSSIEHKSVTMFLSLSPYGPNANHTIPSLVTSAITVHTQVVCKPYRLWIDDAIAAAFVISGLYVNNYCFLMGNDIPAVLFRTGRWPLTKNQADCEMGIDLSSWPTMNQGESFGITVRNTSGCAIPFRGALEVIT